MVGCGRPGYEERLQLVLQRSVLHRVSVEMVWIVSAYKAFCRKSRGATMWDSFCSATGMKPGISYDWLKN